MAYSKNSETVLTEPLSDNVERVGASSARGTSGDFIAAIPLIASSCLSMSDGASIAFLCCPVIVVALLPKLF